MKVKLIGPERCDVPGVGVVKPGEGIEVADEVRCQALPRFEEWWSVVKDAPKKKASSKAKPMDTQKEIDND